MSGKFYADVIARAITEVANRGICMQLTVALERYDRHVPIFNGAVTPPKGVTLNPIEVGESHDLAHGNSRHRRMLKDREFDIAEMSLASWVAFVAQNPDLPLVGIPIFSRRFFSLGQIYVGAQSTAEKPADLVGRKVGLHSFQTTLSVLAKGDFKREYGIAWQQIHWICKRPEIIDVDLGAGIKIDWLPPGKDIGVMLMEGEIDAFMSPDPPPSMMARPDGYRRLFRDSRAEELRYFRKYGFYPVMHLLVAKRELVESNPALPHELMRMFEDAKRIAYGFYNDPNYSLAVWLPHQLEQQRQTLGADPFINGFKANRKNLAQFLEDSHDQKLTKSLLQPETLFHSSTWDT
jgi:4,5-dihydroxyphthalate decarboxylase